MRLPARLPDAVIARLSKVRIRGQALALSTDTSPQRRSPPKPHRKGPKPRRD